MRKKTQVLHYIALNPGKTVKQISESMDKKMGTARTYVSDLYLEGKLTPGDKHTWNLSKHISVESLNIPPPKPKVREPWQDAYDCIMSMMRMPHVS